jgi:glycosyltransferase involved in cell wall biosynthesis
MPAERIALGYNAVDNAYFTAATREARLARHSEVPAAIPPQPYFLCVCRFAPEKNLIRLIEAFGRYRSETRVPKPWDLVLIGDGPQAREIDSAVAASDCSEAIHRPGFLQADRLPVWYAHASAFVLASVSEPWGLVVNEAACAGLPLLVSSRAGCSETLVPDSESPSGARFDPLEPDDIVAKLCWMAALSDDERRVMGERSQQIVGEWGPERFARGTLEALDLAQSRPIRTPLRSRR